MNTARATTSLEEIENLLAQIAIKDWQSNYKELSFEEYLLLNKETNKICLKRSIEFHISNENREENLLFLIDLLVKSYRELLQYYLTFNGYWINKTKESYECKIAELLELKNFLSEERMNFK